MPDNANKIVPSEVVQMAHRAPVGHELWFKLTVGVGEDEYVVLVRPTTITREKVERYKNANCVCFSYEAIDEDGNRYVVETRDRLAHYGLDDTGTFKPFSTIERFEAEPARPRAAHKL